MKLDGARREDILRRSWLANDGLWFYAVQKELGIEAANRLNAAVVRESARLEMTRLLRALGLTEVRSSEQYVALFRVAAELFLTGIFECVDTLDGQTHSLEVRRCQAYEGVERAGLGKLYRCGPGERAQGWLDALGLQAALEPSVGFCQMAHRGACAYRVVLPAERT